MKWKLSLLGEQSGVLRRYDGQNLHSQACTMHLHISNAFSIATQNRSVCMTCNDLSTCEHACILDMRACQGQHTNHKLTELYMRVDPVYHKCMHHAFDTS